MVHFTFLQQIKQREHTEKVNLLLSCGQYKLWPHQPLLQVAELIEWISYPPNTGKATFIIQFLILVLLNSDIPCFANSTDPDQLVSEEANCSGCALFVIKNVILYQQPESSNLIIQHDMVCVSRDCVHVKN